MCLPTSAKKSLMTRCGNIENVDVTVGSQEPWARLHSSKGISLSPAFGLRYWVQFQAAQKLINKDFEIHAISNIQNKEGLIK